MEPRFAHDAPDLPRPTVFDQRWQNLTFLHWAVDPEAVAPFLPTGAHPDVWSDGQTYVGLVPFHMTHAGPGRWLPIPYFGWFLETNVRLYSVDDEGNHGVVFRTLDASRLAVVLLARYGLRIPYTWARMRSSIDGPRRTYSARRRFPRPAVRTDIVIDVGDVIDPTPLEDFLTLRWGMHTSWGGHTWWLPNRHERWPLHEATLVRLQDELGSAAGLPLHSPPDLRPLWTAGVHTWFGRPTRIS